MFGITKGVSLPGFNDYGTKRPNYKKVWNEATRKNELVAIPGSYHIHKAIDIGNEDWQSWPVYCPCLVGNVVWIEHYKGDNGFWPAMVIIEDLKNVGYFHRMAHLDPNLKVHIGQWLTLGTPIGRTASSETLRKIAPASTMNAHLHYEIFKNFKVDEKVKGGTVYRWVSKTPEWPQDYCDPLAYLSTFQLHHGATQGVVRQARNKIS